LGLVSDSQTWLRFLRKEANLVWALLTRKIRIHGFAQIAAGIRPLFSVVAAGTVAYRRAHAATLRRDVIMEKWPSLSAARR
jgi:putative sterol carrier protein